jgi:hypothetical protein
VRKEAALFEKSAQKLSFWASPPLTPPVREAPNEVFLLLFVHKKKTLPPSFLF